MKTCYEEIIKEKFLGFLEVIPPAAKHALGHAPLMHQSIDV
jgi:hypothetical protein